MQLRIDRWALSLVLIEELIAEGWRARVKRDCDMCGFVLPQGAYQRGQEAVSASSVNAGAASQSAWDGEPRAEDHGMPINHEQQRRSVNVLGCVKRCHIDLGPG